MNRSPGILSPTKTPDGRSSESPDEEQEETFATRARDEIADAKSGSKFVRVLTVMAYVLCVSMAAILLSLYYVLVWDPQPDTSDYDPVSPSALKSDGIHHQPSDYVHIDGFDCYKIEDIPEPTPIPLIQDNILTTLNSSSMDYEGRSQEVPDYEDTFSIPNNTFVEKSKRQFLNNYTEEPNLILQRLANMVMNSTDKIKFDRY